MTLTELKTEYTKQRTEVEQYIRDYTGVKRVECNIISDYFMVQIGGFKNIYFWPTNDITDIKLEPSCDIPVDAEELSYEDYVERAQRPKRALKQARQAYLAYNYITSQMS